MEDEWKTLSTQDKLVHKLWRARAAGFEELKIFFETADQNHPDMSKFTSCIRAIPNDANEMAREKGLMALLAFLNSLPCAHSYVADIMPAIIAKCLLGRPKGRELAIEIVNVCIEIEAQSIVVDELVKGCENKMPKLAQSCIFILRSCFSDFGPNVIPLKAVIKQASNLIEHKDNFVRDEAKLAFIDCYRWVGGALTPKLNELKPIVRAGIVEACEQIKEVKTLPSRYLRSQRPKEPESVESAEGDAEREKEKEDGEVADDVLNDLIEPFNLLGNLAGDFYTKIAEKKWQERKEALEDLEKLASKPLLTPGSYNELFGSLKKVIVSDTNVLLVAIAARCLALIAKGTKRHFDRGQIPDLVECCLVRAREKNATAVEALREAANVIFDCDPNIENVFCMLNELLVYKIPQVRQYATEFLNRAFEKMTSSKITKKLMSMYVPILIKNCSVAEPNVRNATFYALATLMRKNQQILKPHLSELEAVKLDKITQFANEAPTELKPGGLPSIKKTDVKMGEKTETPKSAHAEMAKTQTETAKSRSVKGRRQPKPSGSSNTSAPCGPSSPPEAELTVDTVVEMMKERIGDQLLAQMLDSNWKERLSAFSSFFERVQNDDCSEFSAQVFVLILMRKPGLRDPNYQVLKARIELIDYLTASRPKSLLCATLVIPDLVDKLSDAKNGPAVQKTLSNLAEWIGYSVIVKKVLECLNKAKSPKVVSFGLEWFASSLNDFGSRNVDVKALIDLLKPVCTSALPQVKTAAISALSTLLVHVDSSFTKSLNDEVFFAQVQSELEKFKGQPIPSPTRGLVTTSKALPTLSDPVGEHHDVAVAPGEACPAEGDEGQTEQATRVTKVNIQSLISDELMSKVNDKVWTIRLEGIEELSAIVKANEHI